LLLKKRHAICIKALGTKNVVVSNQNSKFKFTRAFAFHKVTCSRMRSDRDF
jgi:hypothetical protein